MNLEKEVICGYEVSAKMKRIWAMQLGILKSFVAVCEAYNLTYFMEGGTLLGAVRHHGYIPWDNDIDISMPRKDFDRLLEIGPAAFQKPLFFQTPVTEQGRFFIAHAKIRDERGTGESEENFRKGINCGMFIDVFCLDEIPNGVLRRKLFYRHLNEISKMKRFCLGLPLPKGFFYSIKHVLQKFVYKYIYHSPDAAQLFEMYQKASRCYAGRGTYEVGNLYSGHHDNFVWLRSDWSSVIKLDFEDCQFNAPVGYKLILERTFGDYMQFPDDKSCHDYCEFDPDVPYTKYFKRSENSIQ